MIVYLLLTAFVLLTAFQVRAEEQTPYGAVITKQYLYNRIAFAGMFLALFLVSALRINVGNDYATYVEFMHRIGAGFWNYVPTEVGFNALTAAVYVLCGFENYLLVFALFAAATCFCFLYAIFRLSDNIPVSIALFMLLGYYFQSISTVRYYLALSLAFVCVYYVLRGDAARFLILTVCGALFHKSMLVILVLYPLARIRWRKWMYVLFTALAVSCLFLQDVYLNLLVKLYPTYEDTVYLEGGTSLVNIIRCTAVLLFAFCAYRSELLESDDAALRFYYHANLMALALYVFCSFLPVVSRIAYYLSVTQIVFLPMIVNAAGKRLGDGMKKKLQAALVLLAACYFVFYMRGAAADGVRILPYQTFLFHEMPPILSEMGTH